MSLLRPQTVETGGGDIASRLSAEAFADAFTAHSRALWCIAAGVLGRRDQVEDVLQEAAVIALEKLDRFQPDTSFIAWMGRIVRYVALNHGRRRQRTRAADIDALASVVTSRPVPPAPPADSAGRLGPDQGAFDDAVVHGLRGLDDTARACILLRTILDIPYREIALALDIPEGTAMSHVHRSRRALRAHLNDWPEESASSTIDREAR